MATSQLENKVCQCKLKKLAKKKTMKIYEHCRVFNLDNEILLQVQKIFDSEITKGITKATRANSSVKSLPSYVQDMPDGTERGKFLALDLGGTNFRVLLIELKGNNNDEITSKIYELPQQLMNDTGEKLFDHIASCLLDFTTKNNLNDEHLPLGFTFSFPLRQEGLNTGYLVRWTKNFNCPGVVDKNVVQMLNEAIGRLGSSKINVVAIVNDTVGTLMACAWTDHECRIGVIVGTGSNACFVEKVSLVEIFDGNNNKPNIILNIEWGSFGENGCLDFIRTEFDKIIDENSINPKQQLFEKMISGMYLGELVRLLIMKFIEEKLLFNGMSSDLIEKKNSFKTSFLTEIEDIAGTDTTNCRRVLKELKLEVYATEDDCNNVRYICECVSKRSAFLVATGLSCLVNRINENNCTIGYDGSVFRLHPRFTDIMSKKIKELIRPGLNFKTVESTDGSGKGAAIIAAIAEKKN